MRHQAVITDLDGTCFHSSPAFGIPRLARIAANHRLALTPDRVRIAVALWGMPGVPFVQEVLGIGPTLAARIYREWEDLDLTDPSRPVAGAWEAITWLSERQIPACLLTSRWRVTTLALLEHARLRDRFLHIAAGDDGRPTKPDPRAFDSILAVLAERGIPRELCVYVGDTKTDIEAASRAGIEMVVVETGPYRDAHEKTHPVPESHVIESIAALPSWLLRQAA